MNRPRFHNPGQQNNNFALDNQGNLVKKAKEKPTDDGENIEKFTFDYPDNLKQKFAVKQKILEIMQSSKGALAKFSLESQDKIKFNLNTKIEGWEAVKEKITDLLPLYREVILQKGSFDDAKFQLKKFLQSNPL